MARYDNLPFFNSSFQEKPILASDVDISELATLTDNYTGADLAGLVRQASLYALKESISSSASTSQMSVSRNNFTDALKQTKPSVSEQVYYHIFNRCEQHFEQIIFHVG